MKNKLFFLLTFLIETVFLTGSIGVLTTLDIRVSMLSPVIVIGSFFIANKDIKRIFRCFDLEKLIMQFMLGVMELIASLLIRPLVLVLSFCDVISMSFANSGFVVVGFCLFMFSVVVIIISLFQIWICVFRMQRNNDSK